METTSANGRLLTRCRTGNTYCQLSPLAVYGAVAFFAFRNALERTVASWLKTLLLLSRYWHSEATCCVDKAVENAEPGWVAEISLTLSSAPFKAFSCGD